MCLNGMSEENIGGRDNQEGTKGGDGRKRKLKKGGNDKQKIKIVIKSNQKFHSKFIYKTCIHQCYPSSGILGELGTMQATLHDVELEHIELHK